MKLFLQLMIAVLMTSLAAASRVCAQEEADEETEQRVESTLAAEANVIVTLCVGSGNVTVSGVERREVRAQVGGDGRVELRRAGAASATGPAANIEVLVADSPDEEPRRGACGGNHDVALSVPREATLYLKTQAGDVEVEDVAEARIEVASGNISLRRVSRMVETTSMSGDISLENSSGRIRLRTISGDIEAKDVRALNESDYFKADTVSGDLRLERVDQAHVEVTTVNGEVTMTGSLARDGRYDFRTTNGNIVLTLPSDASFQVNAKVSQGGEIVTDFPLKYANAAAPSTTLQSGQLTGTYGTGNAMINLTSFNGTLYLRQR
ncbi:MAG TPA: DUF4097 family beta strand repeat-containing protein [Pyrinomonadaceae bacterium]|nr:DUF4097 family beta strand repeat-containing protein [Pyrinomonadaceae bacterium]